jgi:Putative peptidoglycan-binding domain-containing protein
MKSKFLIRVSAVCMAMIMALTPINSYASTLVKHGAHGTEVKRIQTSLRDLGFYKYPKLTGYYGSITMEAVKRFQRANGLFADGIVGRATKNMINKKVNATKGNVKISSMSVDTETAAKILGAVDWFSVVREVWTRGTIAEVTDIDTGRSFRVMRTYGTNHADVEPLTLEDTKTIKEIWGGFSWDRRAVVVKINNSIIAGAMSAMPHAGVDSKPADAWINNRSQGYGWGDNLDSIKNNGANGVMDLHFKNSRTHGTNTVQKSMQDMIEKAADYIKGLKVS